MHPTHFAHDIDHSPLPPPPDTDETKMKTEWKIRFDTHTHTHRQPPVKRNNANSIVTFPNHTTPTTAGRQSVRLVRVLRARPAPDRAGPGGAGAPDLVVAVRLEQPAVQGPADVREPQEALGEVGARR